MKLEKEDEKKKEEEEKRKAVKDRKARKDRMKNALRKIKNDYKSWDGSPDGVKGSLSAEAVQVLGSQYAAELREAFRDNFSVPEVIPDKDYENLKTKILIKIDRSGRIIDNNVTRGSGNSIFDSAALKAVKLTKQVPLPDELLQNLVFKEGIIINFYWKE